MSDEVNVVAIMYPKPGKHDQVSPIVTTSTLMVNGD